MKIIDILVAKANGILEDGFKFCYENEVYTYNKTEDKIDQGNTGYELGRKYVLEKCLNDEVLLFQDKTETQQESKEIKKFTSTIENYHSKDTICQYCNAQTAKINELVRAVNKLTKETEVKQ